VLLVIIINHNLSPMYGKSLFIMSVNH